MIVLGSHTKNHVCLLLVCFNPFIVVEKCQISHEATTLYTATIYCFKHLCSSVDNISFTFLYHAAAPSLFGKRGHPF